MREQLISSRIEDSDLLERLAECLAESLQVRGVRARELVQRLDLHRERARVRCVEREQPLGERAAAQCEPHAIVEAGPATIEELVQLRIQLHLIAAGDLITREAHQQTADVVFRAADGHAERVRAEATE